MTHTLDVERLTREAGADWQNITADDQKFIAAYTALVLEEAAKHFAFSVAAELRALAEGVR